MHELLTPTPPRSRRCGDADAFAARIGRLAVRSLYAELTLYPKPGLVSLVDNGSHADMNAATFMRSLFALRGYFVRITLAGLAGAPFAALMALGIDAETRMLRATGGINTHRGAIFCLGLLCASIGACHARGTPLSAAAIRQMLLARWGDNLALHAAQASGNSHGLQAARQYSASGARQEAALGMPSVFRVALPEMLHTLEAGGCIRRARIDALFALMANISDTNLYHRGGSRGALLVREHARAFLRSGGTADPSWEIRALDCHRIFVAARLSPGGAADLLAGACLVHGATG
ncbi:MAG TPA: triphosphoribosyl-dephospho-CoA synthase MdcB [Telluria sp.]|nr:triphosphoribosyl-dephospho-CoA synthase MdcB [Telluria sp.]